MRKSDLRRRWLGAAFLFISAAMLISGETLLRNRLAARPLLIFWLVCLLFTVLAIWVALRDAAAVRRHAREQRRELLKKTLDEIAEDERRKSRGPPEPPGPQN